MTTIRNALAIHPVAELVKNPCIPFSGWSAPALPGGIGRQLSRLSPQAHGSSSITARTGLPDPHPPRRPFSNCVHRLIVSRPSSVCRVRHFPMDRLCEKNFSFSGYAELFSGQDAYTGMENRRLRAMHLPYPDLERTLVHIFFILYFNMLKKIHNHSGA